MKFYANAHTSFVLANYWSTLIQGTWPSIEWNEYVIYFNPVKKRGKANSLKLEVLLICTIIGNNRSRNSTLYYSYTITWNQVIMVFLCGFVSAIGQKHVKHSLWSISITGVEQFSNMREGRSRHCHYSMQRYTCCNLAIQQRTQTWFSGEGKINPIESWMYTELYFSEDSKLQNQKIYLTTSHRSITLKLEITIWNTVRLNMICKWRACYCRKNYLGYERMEGKN